LREPEANRLRALLSLIIRVSAGVPNDLMIIAGQLRRPELETKLVDLASEAERHLVILVVNGGAGIDSHIEGLVYRDEKWNSVRDLACRMFFIVHSQNARTALAEPGSIVFEVEHDGVLARPERVRAFPAIAFEADEVIEKDRLALEQIHAVATEAPAFRDDH